MPRIVEILLSGAMILVLAPVIVVVAIVVKLDSPGPVIFAQTRVGRGGMPFTIYKFRSMTDARGVGPSVTVGGDARVTGVGRVLRRTKLDEVPQLFNVLEGTMSFVGPRPEVPDLIVDYPEACRATMLSVRPGITDPASILYRDEESTLAAQDDPIAYYKKVVIPQKCAIYREYIVQKTFRSDMVTIGQTLKALL